MKILELPTTLMDVSHMDNAMARMVVETINNMLIELYAAMAEAEIEKKEKRQREGIQAKKDRGEWDDYGRPRSMSLDDFAKEYEAVREGKVRPCELMKTRPYETHVLSLCEGTSKRTFWRIESIQISNCPTVEKYGPVGNFKNAQIKNNINK